MKIYKEAYKKACSYLFFEIMGIIINNSSYLSMFSKY